MAARCLLPRWQMLALYRALPVPSNAVGLDKREKGGNLRAHWGLKPVTILARSLKGDGVGVGLAASGVNGRAGFAHQPAWLVHTSP